MKKSHLFALLVIAAAVVIIISTAGDASTYVTFSEAREIAAKGNPKSVHVVGELKKDASGQVVGVTPGADLVSMSFLLIDENGETHTVQYNNPMPPDMLKSEKVVVIGRYDENRFLAEKILLKCPSKYQEQNFAAINQ